MAVASFHPPVRIASPPFPTRTPNTKHLLFRSPTHPRPQNRRNPRRQAKPRPSDTLQPLLSSALRILDRIRGDDINLEILGIAVPAILALAADPIALLVDTAFVGHLGSAELAAIGVSVSVFNLVSKLFNIPLLNVTTSFVAAQQALEPRPENNAYAGEIGSSQQEPIGEVDGESRKSLPAVSTSLLLAAVVGILESVGLIFGLGVLMDFMGIAVVCPMKQLFTIVNLAISSSLRSCV